MKKLLFCLMALTAPAWGDILVTPGVGKTVHTDSTGGVEYQYIKIADGTTGGTSSATVTSIGLKVDLTTTTISGALPVGANIIGALSANQSVNTAQIGGGATLLAAPGEQVVSCNLSGSSNTVTLPANASVNVAQIGGGTTLLAAAGEQKISCQVAGDSNTVTATQSGTWTVQPGNTPNTVAWLVQVSSGGVNGSTMPVVNATGTKLLVTPDSVALPANQSVNVNQIAGSAVVAAAAGEQKVSCQVAGDSNTVVANAGSGTFNIQANASTNLNQIAGSAITAAAAGEQKVSVQIAGDSNTVTDTGNLADNGAAAATNRLPTLPSIYQNNYLNGTAATQGRNGALSQGTDGLLWSANLPAIRPASYSASTPTVTVAASATDIAAICGNATNTVLVYGMRVSCTQTTAGIVPLTILRRSTGYQGVWSTMTIASDDPSAYNVQASSAIFFTANPTVGTLVGHLDNYYLGCMATGTASPNDIYISPADWRMKPKVLVGTGQCIAANLEQKTVTGGAFSVTFDYIETSNVTP